jgi:hypothetical protein
MAEVGGIGGGDGDFGVGNLGDFGDFGEEGLSVARGLPVAGGGLGAEGGVRRAASCGSSEGE